MQAMPFNEITANLSAVMDRVHDDHEPLVVTRDNKKSVVLISLDDFNAWQETEYLTRSPANAEDLRLAVEELRARKNLGHYALIETP
ncbi:type II toxin-antitoxin system Phd/YefM family antitoxin [Thiorhodovibrio frisius]|jgi:antitoxin YefM|uniref:Antitoxin n=1 Tax=Thiorhodovibrio frisius TaxID=631362 RepID=H8Z864_9GAMM|nr:type II toxin-antitoxin system prevent-host-death family antitoxin [Thiorhodovibrio frisius]EIC21013.1 prevent-host-death family protein [Thiorhodovibrio frisius]WPL22069.1 Antitoxin YefM [Thiorhodovibrio frisius]